MSHGRGFFHELQRRHVVRVAIAYAIAAWVLLQVASILFPALGAPDWVLRIFIALLALGFPLALILAWAFELTPDGVRRTEPEGSPDVRLPPQQERVGRTLNAIVIGVLVVAVAVLSWRQFGGRPRSAAVATPAAAPAAAPAKSIAVLPFESLSEDKANAYFATGMQDEILTRLANIRDLKVISRTSTEKYASHPPDLKTAGLELGVASVLEGTVQKAGDSVHINLQLIDTGSDSHRWAQSYDRELKDIFAVERDVAENVAGALKATLLPEEAERVASVPTQDTEAHDLYLRALAFANHANDQYALTPALMPQAIELLQQALARDPTFAKAAALLGRAHMYMFFFGPDRSQARLAAAKDASEQALRLQPDLGEAPFALAFYWYWGFREYDRARAELALARRTMPHSYDIEEIDAAIARRQGQWERTLEGLRQAGEFDPRNASVPFEFGQTYAHLRRYAEADRAYARAGELSADPALSQIRRAQNAFLWKGDLASLRATLAALPANSDAYRTSRAVSYDLAWWSHDFATAVKVAQDDRNDTWTMSRGNAVLPRLLRLAWAEEALGEQARAHELYASVRTAYEEKVHAQPGDWDLHSALGLACAGLGLKDEAIAEGRRAVDLLPISRDAFAGTEYALQLAHIYARVGETDQAIALLQQLMSIPAGLSVSAARLRVDPSWDPLRADPRFLALTRMADATQGGAASRD
jgi:TolB-like protein/Tfp pilus assembly protein PilF